jgi:hypothetical protein
MLSLVLAPPWRLDLVPDLTWLHEAEAATHVGAGEGAPSHMREKTWWGDETADRATELSARVLRYTEYRRRSWHAEASRA